MNYERKLSVIWLVFSNARNSPDGVSIICVAQLQQLTFIMCTLCQPLLSALTYIASFRDVGTEAQLLN